MSRENYLLKAKTLEGTDEYIHIGNITRFSRVAATEEKGKSLPAHTVVHMVGGDSVKVVETVEDLDRRGSAYGVLRVVQ